MSDTPRRYDGRMPRARVNPVVSLLTVAGIWDVQVNRQLRSLGLTTRKYGLLAHIHAAPGISFSELARRSQITVQTAHTAVRALVESGLVADATAHAGAASDLRTTAAGMAALAEADARLEALGQAFAERAPALAAALDGMHEAPVGEDLPAHA